MTVGSYRRLAATGTLCGLFMVAVICAAYIHHDLPAALASEPSYSRKAILNQDQVVEALVNGIVDIDSRRKVIEQSAEISNRRLRTIGKLLWVLSGIGTMLTGAILWFLIATQFRNANGSARPKSLLGAESRTPNTGQAPGLPVAAGLRAPSSVGALGYRGCIRLSKLCHDVAIIVLNMGLLFVAINLIALPFLPHRPTFEKVHATHAEKWRQTYSLDLLKSLYPGLSDAEVVDKTKSKSSTGVVYEPFIQFRTEPAIGWPATDGAGVHEVGFRLIGPERGAWPPASDAIVIFVFGGSTTIGVRLRDAETIPAQLQRMLRNDNPGRRIDVYNFGAPGYFSAVERVYFEKLLVRGTVPNVAVFLDGYNDFHIWRGEPGSTWWVREQFVKWYRGETDFTSFWYLRAAWDRLPAIRLIEVLRAKQTLESFGGPAFDGDHPIDHFRDPVKIEQIVERFEMNMRLTKAVGDAFGVRTIFVIQPVAAYKYDGDTPLGPLRGEGQRTKWGYPPLRERLAVSPLASGVHWCADVQTGITRNLYVDQAIHCNVEGSRLVARCIADGLNGRGLMLVAR